MSALDALSARRWTRTTLGITLGVSLLANVGHTLLAASTVPAWLRMIGAVAWPMLVFLAVEVLVRNTWQRRNSHRFARLLILLPGIPALITSYEHMHAVLLAMGERPFIAAIGPGAVDTLMIGCTLTLLFMRTPEPLPEIPAADPIPAEVEMIEQETATGIVEIPAPIVKRERPERTPRPAAEDRAEAIRLLLAGETPAVTAEKTGVALAALRRYQTQINKLRTLGADAELPPASGVGPELMLIIRDGIRRERAR